MTTDLKLAYMQRLANAINDESTDPIIRHVSLCDFESKLNIGWPNPYQQ